MMPCAMVYAALFTAMLTGSGGAGATTMVAFGIGTLPGLIAASFGFRRLAGIARGGPDASPPAWPSRVFGIATVFLAHPTAALLCLHRQRATESAYAPRVSRPISAPA